MSGPLGRRLNGLTVGSGSVWRVLLVAGLLLGLLAPAASATGADPPPAPTPKAPPGPWAGKHPPAGVAHPVAGARRCGVASIRHVGPGTVLGLDVSGTNCRAGRRLVRVYQRCLGSHCYGAARRFCVQPVFLGGCRLFVRLLPRVVAGFRCFEQRRFRIGRVYDATVSCTRGRARVDHAYTLFRGTAVAVSTEPELRAAWANPRITSIALRRDIFLRACRTGDPIRESSVAVTLDGGGHTLRQTCFEKRLLRQDGTGLVVLRHVTLTRGGTDGPGAAVTTRGEIEVIDSKVTKNLSEEPGGGIFSMRRATIIRSVITGNLANDDGGGVYARRGGIEVFDSIVSGNLVDGSGGALGSTGDILVVGSHVDGNTTDGDGGAIYTDEDGDVTVIDSTVDGSTADGPGGAIFTLDGDVTIVGSTLNGNRADDRGGAIAGESDVTVIDSTIARNAAVAHVGGGIWARGSLYLANATVANNYAEGEGGGVFAANNLELVHATIASNISPIAADVGAGQRLDAFGSIIGPAKTDPNGGEAQPTTTNCRVSQTRSDGYNVVSDDSCGLHAASDRIAADPLLAPLADNGGAGETMMPSAASPALDLIPPTRCSIAPLGTVLEGEQHLAGRVPSRAALLARDQRGVARPIGLGCDAGAVEITP